MPRPGRQVPPVAGRLAAGLRLALATFTVLPLPAPRQPGDRRVAGAAMALAPVVGVLLGAVLGGAALAVRAVPAPALLTGGLVVALSAGLTRGLHLDGLADTVDALGSYAGRERALAIMKSPEVGPFGVVALVLVLLVQAAAVAGLAARPGYALAAGVILAAATGRLAVTWACRRGVPAARPGGLGALVAGTVPAPVPVLGTVLLAAAATVTVPGRPWQGPVAVLLGLAGAGLVLRHVRRRLGGVTGDVLGALVELASTVCYAACALGWHG